MSLNTELEAARAEVVKLETELAALPEGFITKSEVELAAIYHAITAFFRGNVPPLQ